MHHLMPFPRSKDYTDLTTDRARVQYALPRIRGALLAWMNGEPLNTIQREISNKTRELTFCTGARKFVVRLIPDLAHLMGAPAKIKQYFAEGDDSSAKEVPASLIFANRCVRRGFLSNEMAALSLHAPISRREVHRYFARIDPFLTTGQVVEGRDELMARVRSAVQLEEDARNLAGEA